MMMPTAHAASQIAPVFQAVSSVARDAAVDPMNRLRISEYSASTSGMYISAGRSFPAPVFSGRRAVSMFCRFIENPTRGPSPISLKNLFKHLKQTAGDWKDFLRRDLKNRVHGA
jgi:hypothetical protein